MSKEYPFVCLSHKQEPLTPTLPPISKLKCRPLETAGVCISENFTAAAAFLGVLGLINGLALVLANYVAYKARNISAKFSESINIGIAMTSTLQFIVICAPVFWAASSSVVALFVSQLVLVILPGAWILCLLFVPKVRRHYYSGELGRGNSYTGVTGLTSRGLRLNLFNRSSDARSSVPESTYEHGRLRVRRNVSVEESFMRNQNSPLPQRYQK